MGLIRAAMDSAGGVLADQWKEYFYCDAIPETVLAVKGRKRTGRRSSNRSGSDNIISDGSVIAVADGQCMLITEQGKVVDVCAEPGEFIWHSSTEPSIFAGELNMQSITDVFAQVGKRIGFGGEAANDQRVYYFNTKELTGNKYGTPNPVPFKVVDEDIGFKTNIGLRCFGEYSYHISNPLLFYTKLCGNMADRFDRSALDSQLKSELLTALQPAFAKLARVDYTQLPAHTMEIADALNDVLSSRWRDLRGIEIVSFGISSITASAQDEARLQKMQEAAYVGGGNVMAGTMANAAAAAMQDAANNSAGAMTGFMGMNMTQGTGMNTMGMFSGMGQQPNVYQQSSEQPAQAAGSWTCSCGTVANGKFCPDCGSPRPAQSAGWTCACGSVNKGRFCPECGRPKPAGIPQYRCDKCGWEPADPSHPPKFCPDCGDPFDDGDITGMK